MLLILAAVTAVVALWSAWLHRARAVPRGVRWIGPLTILSTALTALAMFWCLRASFGAVTAEGGGNKATMLAEHLALAMNIVAAGCAVAVIAIVLLGYLTLRYRRPRD